MRATDLAPRSLPTSLPTPPAATSSPSPGSSRSSLRLVRTALPGYTLDGQTARELVTGETPDCTVEIDALATPTVTAARCEGTTLVAPTYPIGSTPGVTYLVDGVITAAGTYPTTPEYTVNVTARYARVGVAGRCVCGYWHSSRVYQKHWNDRHWSSGNVWHSPVGPSPPAIAARSRSESSASVSLERRSVRTRVSTR